MKAIFNFKKFIYLVGLCSILPAIFLFFFPGKIVGISMVQLFLMLFLLSVFLSEKKSVLISIFADRHWVINVFLLLNVITYIRGVLYANSADDWKLLVSDGILSMLFLPYVIICLASKESYWMYFLRFFKKYGFLLCFLLLIPVGRHLGIYDFAHYTSPIYIFILLMPYVNNKLKLMILGISLISFFNDIDVRSNLLNILVSYFLMFSHYINRNIFYKFLIFLRKSFLVLPILFFALGVSGVFNIFKTDQYLNLDSEQKEFVVDSRTGIYTDVILQLYKDKALVYGLGAYGRTETYLSNVNNKSLEDAYREGRPGTESGMLNFFQYAGIIGIIIYMLLFVKSSYLLMYKSNNWLAFILGCWLAFKALFSFIEDKIVFNPNILILFLVFGLAFNKRFRNLKDYELKDELKILLK